MRRLLRSFSRRTRATASVEFAIAMPAVLILVGWFFDLSNLLIARIQLSNAVDNASEYAMLSAGATTSTTLQGIIQKTSGLTGATGSVTGPACYCTSGTPVKLTSTTCGSTCTGGATAGTYYIINANYTYVPILPGLSSMTNTTISETTSVRVQ